MLKVYLDNCCFARPFDNQKDVQIHSETQAKLEIQSLVKLREIELVYSSITIQEISDAPFEEIRNFVQEFIKNNATYYVSSDNNADTIALTEEIMKTGVKLKDASHVACAIIASCDYLITTDKRLIKYTDSRLKILNPINFVEIWRAF
jgi:predicted nucleic acid-binding protein